MSAEHPAEHREQALSWLRSGKSVREIGRLAAEQGWRASIGWVASLRAELAAEAPQAPEHKARDVVQAAGAGQELDLVQLLEEQLAAARNAVNDPRLGARDRGALIKTTADLARLLRDARREQAAEKKRPQVILYFPERTDIIRLESSEQ